MNSYLAIKVQDLAHPWDVVLDPELTVEEKRTILASWASDVSAVESRPGFRWLAGTPGPVPMSHIRSALLALDQAAMRGDGPARSAPMPMTVPAGRPLHADVRFA